MDQAQASQAIFSAWIRQWSVLAFEKVGVSVPFTLDNVGGAEGGDLFASVRIISLSSDEETMGPRSRSRTEHSGIIEVRLSDKPNVGRGRLDALAGAVRQIYQRQRLGRTAHEKGVVTHATEPAELTRDKESSGRWILTLSTPFDYIQVGSS